MNQADLNVHLIDLSQEADAETIAHLSQLEVGRSLVVCNKADLPRVFDTPLPSSIPVVTAALAENQGIDEIREALRNLLADSVDLSARPHAVISERHRELLVLVQSEVQACLEQIADEGSEDVVFAITRLRDALIELGRITGREYHEELLDSIFGQFCIGK